MEIVSPSLIRHPLIRASLFLLCLTVLPFSIEDGLRDWGLLPPLALTPTELQRWAAVRFWCVALPVRVTMLVVAIGAVDYWINRRDTSNRAVCAWAE